MFQMITGYWISQAIGALATHKIVDHLPGTPADLAKKIGLDEAALARLLRTSASVGILREESGRYSATPIGDTLRSDVPGSMRDFAIAQTAPGHWLPWGAFPDAIRTGTRQTTATLGMEIFDHYAAHPTEGAAFSGAMNSLSMMVASEVARVVDAKSASRVVDIGGAAGTLVLAMLNANPHLSGVLLDLPHVVKESKAKVESAIGSRCEIVGGDFFSSVPEADIHLLKQVIHDWDDEKSRTILKNCARSLRKGGRVVLIEMIVPADGQPSPAHLMDLNMLVMLPGRERTLDEYTHLLEDAGLKLERVCETRSPFQVIEAIKA
jgi:SAM-dependent methyltransferase